MGILLFGIWNSSTDVVLRGLPSFRECIITRVKVLAVLKIERCEERGRVWYETKDLLHLHKDVLVGWKFAISGEQLLLLRIQFL